MISSMTSTDPLVDVLATRLRLIDIIAWQRIASWAEQSDLSFEDLRLHRVTAICFADNQASWRLMERVGMRREAHHVRDSLHRTGQWMDTMVYALLGEEWVTTGQAASAGR